MTKTVEINRINDFTLVADPAKAKKPTNKTPNTAVLLTVKGKAIIKAIVLEISRILEQASFDSQK